MTEGLWKGMFRLRECKICHGKLKGIYDTGERHVNTLEGLIRYRLVCSVCINKDCEMCDVKVEPPDPFRPPGRKFGYDVFLKIKNLYAEDHMSFSGIVKHLKREYDLKIDAKTVSNYIILLGSGVSIMNESTIKDIVEKKSTERSL